MENSAQFVKKIARTNISSIDEYLFEGKSVVFKTYFFTFLKKVLPTNSEDEDGFPVFSTGRKFFLREKITYEKLAASPGIRGYYPEYLGNLTDEDKSEVLIIEKADFVLMYWSPEEKNFFFENKDFEARLKSPKFLTEIIWRMIQCLRGLHSLNIAHLDLKSDNFLLFDDRPKLADFNSSREFPRSKKVGLAYGNFMFAAPETFNGCGSYDPFKADIWALGVVLYLLMTKKLPFSLDKQEENDFIKQSFEIKVTKEEIDFEKVPANFRDLIKGMLAKNPNERLECEQLVEMKVFDGVAEG